MSNRELTAFTRREFLFTGLTLASAAVAVPSFIERSALGLTQPAAGTSSIPGVPEERVLVVVQLSGGNDGLNTVIPYLDDAYYRSRPVIGIKANEVLKLDKSDVGLHPGLAGFRDLHAEGMLTVVQGVGYPNPNRSHFKSMDIWHTADTTATGDGWLGRYFDAECCGYGKGESGRPDGSAKEALGQPGIAVMREAPLAMRGRKAQPIAFESAESFRWTGGMEKKDLAKYYEQLTKGEADAKQAVAAAGGNADANSNFLTRTALDAQVSSDTIRKAVAASPRVTYPSNKLGEQLQMVASMVNAKLKTRVYYVSLGGFDTHDNQGGANGRHAQLMTQLSSSVKAFYADLKKQGNDGRVMTMVFSEFGRRVAQNGSNGTDHGTAAPMFLIGPMVQPGVATRHPSLTDLDQGDLKFNTDFRSVYAGILGGWLKADAKAILEGNYTPAPVLKKA